MSGPGKEAINGDDVLHKGYEMNGMFVGMMVAEAARRAATQAESAVRKSQSRTTEVRREMAILGERLDKLILINAAMWSLLQERTGLSEEDLTQRAQEIDMRDGVPDGKITRTLKKCANCGRTISRRHNKCLFCGSDRLSETLLEDV